MCYSAQIVADHRRYVRDFGVEISIEEFVRIFWWRTQPGSKVRIPKAMEASFSSPETDGERTIKSFVDEFNAAQRVEFEQELFKQRKRLADARRTLVLKPTKAAAESERIASAKITALRDRMTDLGRQALLDRDARIFPGGYAPVIVMEHGRRVLKPMRYQCRPAGKPALFDARFPGTYNARRDNLRGFWKDLYGFSHGLMVVDAFFENVPRHKVEGRELDEGDAPENVVLEFRPSPAQPMLVACLWSRWSSAGEPDLLSFAAITDDPPPEVAAAGHDRCIVAIRPEHIDAWLDPDPKRLADQEAILEDKAPLFYEYRMAA